ncbi:HAD-IIA family hydrolase [Tessaracoccus oleiagri]|uniref:Haloacid Dehalogenase Superfamily Class (Subfamily) IIA n=1 Tax=Tessaracoccus oleiagri TaxID=686624 RepID=A0A1G9LJN0_9ACTN|nr:HAD-IIA family hydrolase [Tessaracoccus oleiagri]SDL62068.1 Haloacid Dehalogenase Superfamily Class (subfamily) IIA [Tessaracoccus oleiagri]
MLANGYDAALFDLDGVVYLGPLAVPGVPEAIHELREEGLRVGFVTNNAARTPATVAAHLVELGIEASEPDVVNSTMATLHMLSEQLPEGARVLAVGTEALAEQLTADGYTVVASKDDRPVAVVQGYNPRIDWRLLEEGAFAIQAGADWFVTNPDLTRPTDRGLVPGAGTQLAVIQACVTITPKIAGKPYPPLLEETVRRLGAQRPIFVGDRLDTDILGANNVGMDSLLVFTGAHGKRDLADAERDYRPTAIGHDVSALLQPARVARRDGDTVICGTQRATLVGTTAHLDTTPAGRDQQLDALWALLQLRWHDGAGLGGALDQLTEVP